MASQDREKFEKNKIPNQIKHVPKDAQVIMSILKEMGITDYEPRVINQLLEFTYRYVTCILDDAKVYANHAKKKVIDVEDIKLATHMVMEKSFTRPPPREVIFELARAKNSVPLPPIKSNCGLRLPADRYSLSSCNFKLKAATQSKKMIKSAGETRPAIKTNIKSTAQNASTKRPSSTNMGNSASGSTTGTVPKAPATVPKPIFKFSNTQKPAPVPAKPKFTITSSSQPVTESEKMEVDSVKRKREEDDFENVN